MKGQASRNVHVSRYPSAVALKPRRTAGHGRDTGPRYNTNNIPCFSHSPRSHNRDMMTRGRGSHVEVIVRSSKIGVVKSAMFQIHAATLLTTWSMQIAKYISV